MLGVNVRQSHVVPVTSNVARAGIAGNVLLPATVSGLPKDFVVVPLGLELIDRSVLGEHVGRLPRVLFDDIDEGLRAIRGSGFLRPATGVADAVVAQLTTLKVAN